MLRGIFPKEYAFYDFFENLMQINISISEEFLVMTEKAENLEDSSKKIKKLERDADKITRASIDLLHRTFITPIDRDDIFDLIKGLDGFSDQVNAAAFRIANYGISEIKPETITFAQIIHKGVLELDLAVKGLRKIKKSKDIREHCSNIHELENESDEIMRQAIANLFNQTDVPLLFKWKEIFERLEKSVDRLEKVAHTIETILIDNS